MTQEVIYFLVHGEGWSLTALQVGALQLAKCTQRDFFRWVRLPVPITTVEIPVLLDAGESTCGAFPQQESTTTISVVLPSDMLCSLHKAGPEAALLHYLFFLIWAEMEFGILPHQRLLLMVLPKS